VLFTRGNALISISAGHSSAQRGHQGALFLRPPAPQDALDAHDDFSDGALTRPFAVAATSRYRLAGAVARGFQYRSARGRIDTLSLATGDPRLPSSDRRRDVIRARGSDS